MPLGGSHQTSRFMYSKAPESSAAFMFGLFATFIGALPAFFWLMGSGSDANVTLFALLALAGSVLALSGGAMARKEWGE